MARNPNAKVLTFRIGQDKWAMVTRFQINEYILLYPEHKRPDTKIGCVRMFVRDAEWDGMSVRLNRFFDTVEYAKEQRNYHIKEA